MLVCLQERIKWSLLLRKRGKFFLLSGSFFRRSFPPPFVQHVVDLLGAVRIAQFMLINLTLQILDWRFARVGLVFLHRLLTATLAAGYLETSLHIEFKVF